MLSFGLAAAAVLLTDGEDLLLDCSTEVLILHGVALVSIELRNCISVHLKVISAGRHLLAPIASPSLNQLNMYNGRLVSLLRLRRVLALCNPIVLTFIHSPGLSTALKIAFILQTDLPFTQVPV